MNCTVFVSLLTKLSVDKLVTGLFRLGYGVAPVTSGGYLLEGEDSPAAILGMQITAENLEHQSLRNKIKKFLNENEIGYYSIVVVNGQPGIAWAGSNISLSKAKTRMRKDVPYLKRVRKTPPPLPDSE